jgi:hypothetical protein
MLLRYPSTMSLFVALALGNIRSQANSENAKKLLGIGTFTYEESEWKKLNKELRNYTYRIEVL